jgi:O-antigen ligase
MEKSPGRAWDRPRLADGLGRCLIGLPLVALPFFLGGVRPWVWSSVAGAFVLGMVFWIWLVPSGSAGTVRMSKSWLLLVPLVLYPLLQVVPIPLPWLSVLSPERALWIERASTALGVPVQGATLSHEPVRTILFTARFIFLALHAWMLHAILARDKDAGWLFALLFIVAAMEASYGILQALIPSLGVFGQATGNGAASGTFFNRNHYAAFLGMLWPLLLARLLILRDESTGRVRGVAPGSSFDQAVRHKQIFLTLVTGLVLLALFFSQSRAGIVSSLVALSVFVILGGGERRRMLPFVAGCWMVMLVYGSAIGFEEIIERFNAVEESAPGRFNIWQDAWRMVLDHPWTGVGLGAFSRTIMVYQSHLPDTLDIVHAHCDYLEWAAELGLPAAGVLMAALWAYWWRSAWRVNHLARPSGRLQPVDSLYRARRLIRIGALSGAAAFLCHEWVEFGGQVPANQVLFVTLLVLMRMGLHPAPYTSTNDLPTGKSGSKGVTQE